jgi:adenylate cyclase
LTEHEYFAPGPRDRLPARVDIASDRSILQFERTAAIWEQAVGVAHDSHPLSEAVTQFERRYRAILVADTVSYTRLMEAAETETHARYRALRVEVIDPTIVSHRGEIMKNTGDGFVAVFESPLDAVHCAIALQQELANQESSQAPERRIAFRTGIHWDPVIFDMNDVYGRGVNIAVRLQTAAPAGGVVVSSALLGQFAELQQLKLDDLGELRLKNLSQPVHAFSLRLPGIDHRAAPSPPTNTSTLAKLPSIAVLPLANLSADAESDYFCDGLVEDIIVTLSNIPELLVVSRGSTILFRRRSHDLMRISEKLGVRYILSGSARRSENRVRIAVELLDAASTSVIWAERYDTQVDDVFGIQDDIALAIVSRIATYVRQTEVKRAMRQAPQSLNAYDHLLQALELLYNFDFASFSRARTLLEKACEEDRSYAAPYAFLAQWHIFNIQEGWSTDTGANTAEVIRLADCAIERDPSNALALAILGHGKGMYYKDYDAAIELFERAIATSPSNAWAWVYSSATHGFIGDADSAVARAERAIRLSPLDQQAFFNFCLLSQNHYLNGNFNDAIRWSRKALSLNPKFGNSVRVLAASLVAAGHTEEAQRISRHHVHILPGFRVSEYAGRCPFKEPQATLYVERLKAAGLPV